jgi:S1-C subfamily serine protease
MSNKTQSIPIRFVIVLVTSFVVTSCSGDIEKQPTVILTKRHNLSPFLSLGREVSVEFYRNPIIVNNKVIGYGSFVKREIANRRIGSGTLVSQDGVIITNYHVYNLDEKLEYDEKSNTLLLYKPISQDMLVWELDDPLKPPELKYIASPVSWSKKLDIAVLKIILDYNTGREIQGLQFPFVKLGNPFDIKMNEKLTIVGYPGKGGTTITVSEGLFMGYLRGASAYGLDGSIKTNASIAPGNSGGAALYNDRLIGIPTSVTSPDDPGAVFGYIYPITWGLSPLIYARVKYGLNVPDIPKNWVDSEYNTDISKTDIYLVGKILSAQTSLPVNDAIVLIHRQDRTSDQIFNLSTEVAASVTIFHMKNLYDQGYSVKRIAEIYYASEKDVAKVIKYNINLSDFSQDAIKLIGGEFFYEKTNTDRNGVFITTAPRNKKLKFTIIKSGFRAYSRDILTENNVYQDFGRLKVYEY